MTENTKANKFQPPDMLGLVDVLEVEISFEFEFSNLRFIWNLEFEIWNLYTANLEMK